MTLPLIKLVGITGRTNNKAEMNSQTAIIGKTIQKFFDEATSQKIQHAINPVEFFAVYTKYESDHTGDYTYFFGQEVSCFENIEKDLETLIIPAQNYIHITTNPGKMPHVVINAWINIWTMTPTQLGGKRAYIADFERYDQKSSNPENSIVDIFIGINS